MIDENGTTYATGDEDDHDVALISVNLEPIP